MPVKPAPHELILLFALGMKQSQIINLGYSPNTVWKYDKKYKEASKNLINKIMSMHDELIMLRKKKSKQNVISVIKPEDKRLKNPFMSEMKIEKKEIEENEEEV